MRLSSRTRTVVVLGGLLLALWVVWATSGRDAAPDTGSSSSGTVALSSLPSEARETVRLIDRGGPFPYPRDGVVFRNDERLLPQRGSGYYREYTVPTPGSADRGARRIVAGGQGDLWWTADHYRSFRRIDRGGS